MLIRKKQQQILDYIRQREMSELQGCDVYCVVCGHSFSAFAPFYAWFEKEGDRGAEPGELPLECRTLDTVARCPSCGSMERQRLLWKYLTDKTQIFNGFPLRLLEIAPDSAIYDAFSAMAHLDYYPCDLYPERDKYARFEGSILKEDVTALSFADDFFDVILCNHVLEHIPDEGKALGELYRVLKPGGWGIFQVPLDYRLAETYEDATIDTPLGREKAFGQRDHVRQYGRDFPERIARAGFRVEADTFVKTFTPEEIHYFGFDQEEILYRCYK